MGLNGVFSPFQLGRLSVRNRVVLPAHTTNFGLHNVPTRRNVDYLAERARGGVGLVITEAIRVHPSSAGRHQSLGSFTDDSIPAFAELARSVKAEGAAVFAQIMHLGRQASGDATRTAAWGASAVPWARGAVPPHVMGRSDIRTLVRAFGTAARRMQLAGFDGLEVHAGHGHLLEQFLSPVTNHRTDEYGGSPQRRLRLCREVLREVTTQAPGMPIGLRVSMNEFLPGGLHPELMLDIIGSLCSEVELAYVHASHSAYQAGYTLSTQMADMHFPPAPFVEHSAQVKKAFPELPVIAVCRIDSLERAGQLVETGAADLVALARPHIADPHIVAKTIEGRSSEIRSCVACNQACIGRVEQNLPISCVVNPEVGEERPWRRVRELPRRLRPQLLVIGGGPAGLRAAVTGAEAGADVTLLEATDAWGGQINVAASIGGRQRLRLATDELVRDALRLGVKMHLGVRATAESLERWQAQHVIVATGAAPTNRTWAGGPPSLNIQQAIAQRDVLARGERVVLVDGEGTWAAASLAEELAERGVRVELLTPMPTLFARITTYSKANLLERLRRLPIGLHLLQDVVSARGRGVTIANPVTGDTQRLEDVAAIIDIAPARASDAIYRQLDGTGRGVDVVGDANTPRSVLEAVYEGHRAALSAVTTTPDDVLRLLADVT